jgi:hypothetical protein
MLQSPIRSSELLHRCRGGRGAPQAREQCRHTGARKDALDRRARRRTACLIQVAKIHVTGFARKADPAGFGRHKRRCAKSRAYVYRQHDALLLRRLFDWTNLYIVRRLKRWKSKRNCFHVIDDPRWTAAKRRRNFCLAYAPVPSRHLRDAIVDWACNPDRDPTAASLAGSIAHKLLECGQETEKFAPSVTAKVTQSFVRLSRDCKAKIRAASVGDDPSAYLLAASEEQMTDALRRALTGDRRTQWP